MVSFSLKYGVIAFHLAMLAFMITSFFVNKWFLIEDENQENQIFAGLNKFCDHAQCYNYKKHSNVFTQWIVMAYVLSVIILGALTVNITNLFVINLNKYLWIPELITLTSLIIFGAFSILFMLELKYSNFQNVQTFLQSKSDVYGNSKRSENYDYDYSNDDYEVYNDEEYNTEGEEEIGEEEGTEEPGEPELGGGGEDKEKPITKDCRPMIKCVVGEPGPAGPRGPEGPQGQRGEGITDSSPKLQEDQAFFHFGNGEKIFIQYVPGPRGEQGIPGIPSYPGGPGLKGEPGPPGRDGLDGRPGPDGEPGPPGEPGVMGELGHDGARGPDGPAGNPGRDGPPGAPGQQGKSYNGPSGGFNNRRYRRSSEYAYSDIILHDEEVEKNNQNPADKKIVEPLNAKEALKEELLTLLDEDKYLNVIAGTQFIALWAFIGIDFIVSLYQINSSMKAAKKDCAI